ncbi:MAG: PAS domain-containing sensor histidine kinase [Planctomycetota bacterium]|nr:MAG: PAS domain-containing sensor histidine kinase [Planctomycetota bacterium]
MPPLCEFSVSFSRALPGSGPPSCRRRTKEWDLRRGAGEQEVKGRARGRACPLAAPPLLRRVRSRERMPEGERPVEGTRARVRVACLGFAEARTPELAAFEWEPLADPRELAPRCETILVRVPGDDLTLLQRALDACPSSPVVALLETADESLAERCLLLGAEDAVGADEGDEFLARALRNAALRQRALSPARATAPTSPASRVFRALQWSEQLFSELASSARVIPYEAEPEKGFTYVAPQAVEILGYPLSDWYSGRLWSEYVHRDDLECVWSPAQIACGEGIQSEYRVRAADGRTVWLRDHVHLYCADRPVLRGFLLDITELKAVEEELRTSRELYRAMLEQLPAVVWIADGDGRVLQAMGGGLASVGLPSDVLDGQRLDALLEGSSAEWARAALRRVARGERAEFAMEWEGRTWEVTVAPLSLRALGKVIGIALDVTALREAERALAASEAELQHRQKLDAVGRLAGGIAHDFNNLLTVIDGYSEIMLERVPEDDPVHHWADLIHRASAQASALTRQLLAFSRKQALDPKVLDLGDVVEDMRSMLEVLAGEQVRLECAGKHGLWKVEADPSQLQAVIMNLALNARDAMLPKGGTLSIRCRNRTLTTEASCGAPPGDYVELSVHDTGCGMDEEVLAHVFEPFFTTKPAGKGTGLGLASVYGIVKQSGGWVSVESLVGQGSTFRILLPRVLGEESAKEAAERAASAVVEAPTILVVEDEELVRAFACEALRSFGYEVLSAESAEEAVRFVEDEEQPIDLLLTDVLMPGTDGCRLAERLCELRPQLKVLYMSGYTRSVIREQGYDESKMPLLPKPFGLQELEDMVRKVLKGPSGTGLHKYSDLE